MSHEKISNPNHENAWSNFTPEQTRTNEANESYADLGKSTLNALKPNSAELSPDAKNKMVGNKIESLTEQLKGVKNYLTGKSNDLWEQLEDRGVRQPSMNLTWRKLDEENRATMHEETEQAYENLIDEFSSQIKEREFGKIYGEEVGYSGYLTKMGMFPHLSKEGRLGLMETFDLQDFKRLFKEKGIDLNEKIDEVVFDNQLVDQPDLKWDIMGGTKLDENQKAVECIFAGQVYREDQYDDEGKWDGEQWRSYPGSLYINLQDFSDIYVSGDLTEEQQKVYEAVQNTPAKNIYDLIEGGAEKLAE